MVAQDQSLAEAELLHHGEAGAVGEGEVPVSVPEEESPSAARLWGWLEAGARAGVSWCSGLRKLWGAAILPALAMQFDGSGGGRERGKWS